MPAKTTKTKSNVARSKGKSASLNKKIKFNWKIAVVIGVILIAGLGYLYVRLSKAAAFTWNAGGIAGIHGSRVTKSDGREAWQSSPYGSIERLHVAINSKVDNDDTYCFIGKTTQAGGNYSILYHYSNYGDPFTDNQSNWNSILVGSAQLPAGDFRVCANVPGNINAPVSNQVKSQMRFIRFVAVNPKVFAVYTAERVGTTPGQAGAKVSPSPTATPAAK